MAQENTANAGNTPNTEANAQNPSMEGSEPKTFTQEQVNALVGSARTHERQKYPNYEQYKAAFEELEKIKEGEKSDLQKAIERAEKAEGERNALQAEKDKSSWASEVAKATGVPAEVLRGSTKEEMEAHAEALKPHFSKSAAPVVGSDGFAPAAGAAVTNAERFARALDGIF